jgi:hypothetical protein
VQIVENNRVLHRTVQTGARSQQGGQTLVAIDSGVAEGALVLAGRVGPLPEGTALRLPPAPPALTTAPAPAAPAAAAH